LGVYFGTKSSVNYHSYRSSQIVIDTVNTVFGMLAVNPVLSPYPAVVSAWSRRFETHTTVHSDLPGHCRLVTAPAANEDEGQALVTLRWAATCMAEPKLILEPYSMNMACRIGSRSTHGQQPQIYPRCQQVARGSQKC